MLRNLIFIENLWKLPNTKLSIPLRSTESLPPTTINYPIDPFSKSSSFHLLLTRSLNLEYFSCFDASIRRSKANRAICTLLVSLLFPAHRVGVGLPTNVDTCAGGKMEQGYFCRHQSLAAGSRGAPREKGRETGRFLAARQNTTPLPPGSLPFPPRFLTIRNKRSWNLRFYD